MLRADSKTLINIYISIILECIRAEPSDYIMLVHTDCTQHDSPTLCNIQAHKPTEPISCAWRRLNKDDTGNEGGTPRDRVNVLLSKSYGNRHYDSLAKGGFEFD